MSEFLRSSREDPCDWSRMTVVVTGSGSMSVLPPFSPRFFRAPATDQRSTDRPIDTFGTQKGGLSSTDPEGAHNRFTRPRQWLSYVFIDFGSNLAVSGSNLAVSGSNLAVGGRR